MAVETSEQTVVAAEISGGDQAIVEARQLRRTFGATVAVDDVSFEIRRGEILGFLGPNGAGKSTTLRMITGLLAPDHGSARICGVEISEDPLKARQQFGYLPESIPLYDEMEVTEYLRFVGHSRGLEGTDLEQRVTRICERLGLGPLLRRSCGTLSKGFRQRVGLAQALIHDPDVLILDEPTNGLDPRQIIEVRQLIRELSQERAIIFSTHILQEIAAICTRIIVIHSGKLIADGTPEELAGVSSSGWEVVVAGEGISPQLCIGLGVAEGVPGAPGETVHPWLSESAPDLATLSRQIEESGSSLIHIGRARETLEQVYLRLTGGQGGRQ
ncbi:MAG: ABC transporter ATP-binding protein [Planctomycetota bacterium]|nr:ABC transporter ATP-binding protein [Planctomycetota bacterium]